MRTNRQWRLAARPQGVIQNSDFQWREEAVPALADGQVLVRNIYLSLDPTNRVWMNDADSYLPKLPLGAVMRGGAIGVVEESLNPKFTPGQIVQGLLNWQEFAISNGADLSKLPTIPGFPLTVFQGLLGHIGFTAYFGLLDLGQPKPGETLVVSTAAGAVGSLVGQIGKIKGMHVVGLTGTDEKCKWIKEELGYDAAINYKKESVPATLHKHCPKGIDVYFDNVGGEILEAALNQVNLHSRIVLCGAIAQYNADKPEPGPRNLSLMIMKRVRMEGFVVLDYMSRAEEASRELIQWAQQGKLKYRVDVVEGLQQAPTALRKLFDGSNAGKLVVKIGPEPGEERSQHATK
jgi:NADPH-dependent curcumin reductase CurA